MSDPTDLVAFLGRRPDQRLLDDDLRALPEAEQRVEPAPVTPGRALIVGIGATLTGISLLVGVALLIAGVVDAIAAGFRLLDVGAFVVGLLLVSTHWGWVHVAEASAVALERRAGTHWEARNRTWLESIEPYVRWSVATDVLDDGSIRITRFVHRPVAAGSDHFTFTREAESAEVLDAEEPGAHVAERAEALRRRAALDTARERAGWEAAADAYETALLGRDDEEQRAAARRAASRALSEQINRSLREPPLVE